MCFCFMCVQRSLCRGWHISKSVWCVCSTCSCCKNALARFYKKLVIIILWDGKYSSLMFCENNMQSWHSLCMLYIYTTVCITGFFCLKKNCLKKLPPKKKKNLFCCLLFQTEKNFLIVFCLVFILIITEVFLKKLIIKVFQINFFYSDQLMCVNLFIV